MCFAAYVYNINRNDIPTWGRWRYWMKELSRVYQGSVSMLINGFVEWGFVHEQE